MKTLDYDVVVIGGGPGGSTTATFLARAGARVLVLEGTRFPRWHIGESLLAASMPVFEELGVLPHLEQFQRKLGSLWVWGASPSLISLEMPRPGYAFQVQREQFDQLLLDNARAAGAEVRTETWARQPIRDDTGRMTGLLAQEAGGTTFEVRARYVVDASGLFQFLPKRLDLPMDLFGPQRAAVTVYWDGALRPDEPHSADVISEACADGWIWFIPFADGQTGVGFVGDAEDITGAPAEVFTRQIASSQLVRRLLANATMARKPRLLRYTNHTVSTPLWTEGYLLVGDTAAFVDPLFSTGINATVYSASLAAAGIASVLAGDLPEDSAAKWYDERVRGHYRRTTEMTRLLYAAHPGDTRFWRARSLEHLTDGQAEDLLRHIGAGSVELFAKAAADGSIRLPDAIRRLLPEFTSALPPTRLPEHTVLSFADEVELRPDWTRAGGRLVPATRVAHRRRRTHEIDFSGGTPGQRLLAAVDGRRDLRTLLEASTSDGDRRPHLALLAGALVKAGIFRAAGAGLLPAER